MNLGYRYFEISTRGRVFLFGQYSAPVRDLRSLQVLDTYWGFRYRIEGQRVEGCCYSS